MGLRTKIVVWFVSIQLLTMLVLISAAMVYLHHVGNHSIEVRANDALVLISAAVAESLFVVNLNSAREIIDSAFYEIEGISFLQIRGEQDEILAEKHKGSDLIYNSIKVKNTIELGGITFGTLYMHFSLGPLQEILWDQTILLTSFGVLIILLSTLVVFYTSNKIIKIVDQMETGFKKMILNSEPPPIGQYDASLTNLVSAYNELVSKCVVKIK